MPHRSAPSGLRNMQIARICRRCLALVALVFVASTAAAGSPPNFVVVLADDLGYGDASCYGGWIETPHLDRMASRGVRFTDFHSSGNVCSPTRAGLLTGRYQQRAGIPGVVYASDTRAAHYSGLQPSEITLPELLLEAGYDTARFGKWHLGYHPKYNPLNHGFRQFRGYLSGNVDYHTHLDNQGRHDWWNGRQLHPEQGYTTHLITRYAREFLRKRRDNPFFLLVAYEAVHNPYQGPQDPPVRSTDVPGMDHDRRPIKDVYADMMREMDDGMAAILNSLVASGLESNTLVFFFSDNGPTTNGSAGPLRGYKGSDWEGGHRVPAIAWWPGHLDPAVNSQLTSSLDLMPTLLELANVCATRGPGTRWSEPSADGYGRCTDRAATILLGPRHAGRPVEIEGRRPAIAIIRSPPRSPRATRPGGRASHKGRSHARGVATVASRRARRRNATTGDRRRTRRLKLDVPVSPAINPSDSAACRPDTSE